MQHLKDVLLSIGYSYQESDRELNDLSKRHPVEKDFESQLKDEARAEQKWFTHIDKDKDYQDKCDKLLEEDK